jgi:hypothetical protein
MPAIAKDVALVLRLYFRCERFRALPYAGGVLEQPGWIMDLFDVIEEQKEAQARVDAERAENERQARKLRGDGRKRS